MTMILSTTLRVTAEQPTEDMAQPDGTVFFVGTARDKDGKDYMAATFAPYGTDLPAIVHALEAELNSQASAPSIITGC